MQVTLLGGAASDTLEDGRVVSGVGGQYNFVAMSHELRNSYSILMLRSVREEKGRRYSNIIWSHGHLTIPRHLKDIVITEYGIADLKGKTDEETIQALLNITDSEFQEELAGVAKSNGKLRRDYQIPSWAKQNHPEKVHSFVAQRRQTGVFERFPFGSDFTPEEETLAVALEWLQRAASGGGMLAKMKLAGWVVRAFSMDPSPFQKELSRMNFQNPSGIKETLEYYLLLNALVRTKEKFQKL
jgi:hypothetical protein